MAKITVRVDSHAMNAIHRRLDKMPEAVTEGAQEAVKESGEAVREQVERTVRVHTGRLRNSIRVRFVGSLGLTADVGWFDKDTYYAQYQEFGTSSITADPVLTRAGEEEQLRFSKRVAEHIKGKL